MRRRVFCALVFGLGVAIGLILTGSFANAANTMVLYDDFKGSLISPQKWFGNVHQSAGGIIEELVREIKGGSLNMRSHVYGAQNPNGGVGYGYVQLKLQNPSAVTSMKAKVKIAGFESIGTETDPSVARLRLMGLWFNAGDSPPTSLLNDVGAGIQVYRRSDSTADKKRLDVVGFAWRCTDAPCNSGTDIVSGVKLGTVTVNKWANLSVEWDKDNHRFGFQLNKKTKVYSDYSGSASDTYAAFGQYRRLGIDNYVAHYVTMPKKRPKAYMDAYVDNVYVNK